MKPELAAGARPTGGPKRTPIMRDAACVVELGKRVVIALTTPTDIAEADRLIASQPRWDAQVWERA